LVSFKCGCSRFIFTNFGKSTLHLEPPILSRQRKFLQEQLHLFLKR
jgi:hypothetical protein